MASKPTAKQVLAGVERKAKRNVNKNPQPTVDNPNPVDYVDVFGRPTKYKPEMDEQAFKLTLLGCTREEMARYFEVTPDTLRRWYDSYPSFQRAIRAGGDEADMEVVVSLRKQALGYTLETEEAKVVQVDRFAQKVEIVKVVRHIPADYRATGRWLGNRRRAQWSERIEVEQTDPAEAARAAQAAIAAADATTKKE